jgi:hypothetical protein
MDISTKFEAKKQELARIEQRAAFLQGQLQEAMQARERLTGQLLLLQELLQEAQGEASAPEQAPAAQQRTPRGRRRKSEA